jgi:hypothetical protein
MRKMRRIHWYTAENEKTNDTKVISLIILSDLSTMQPRLTFKGHKALARILLRCLVIHLTSISTISYAESNGGVFVLIGRIKPEIMRSKNSTVRVRDSNRKEDCPRKKEFGKREGLF